MKKMYLSLTTALCCSLLLAACSYDKKRLVTPKNQTQEQQQVLETSDNVEKIVLEPDPIGLKTVTEYPADGFDVERMVPAEQVLPDMQYVKDRIFEYGRKLERWKDLDSQAVVVELDESDSEQMVRCFRDLQKVLSGYNRVHEVLLQRDVTGRADAITNKDIMELEQRDIAFLESGCGSLLKGDDNRTAGWEQREEKADLPQIEVLVERYGGSGEFEQVVQVWQQIPEHQLDRVHLNTRITYGNALMALHQQEEAARVYQEIVDLMSSSDDQRTDILSLRKILADLYAASGDYSRAEQQYLEISKDYKDLSSIEEWAILQLSILERSEPGSPELHEYSSLLRSYLGYSPQRDGYKLIWNADKFLADYPYSAVASNVDIIRSTARDKADKWLAAFMAEVDIMAGEKRFQDALLKMESLQEDILSGEKLIEIRKKSDDLTLAAAVDRETRKIEQMQLLQGSWNEALVLADSEKYDESIEILTTMLDTDYGLKASSKIAEISLLAARAERRKAADLFLRYTKTTDTESQKKLLIDSRRYLQDILVKYPDVGIADKVLGNIERVEKEMNRLDPGLIAQADMTAGSGEQKGGRQGQDAFDMMSPLGGAGVMAPVSPVTGNLDGSFEEQDLQ